MSLSSVRVVMFDLGGTLINAAGQPLPHVQQALQAIAMLRTARGRPLATCLVSDYTLAAPPLSPARLKPLFDSYLALLSDTGLRPLFEPAARRVTLSTHVGVNKPDRRVFEAALHRLRSTASLQECLLVTENAAHVAAVRESIHMQALLFGASGGAGVSFSDWAQAPAMIAALVDAANPVNRAAVARMQLATRGIDVDTLEPGGAPGLWCVRGSSWHPIKLPGHEELGAFDVAIPVQLNLHADAQGALHADVPTPDADALAEATSFAASLAEHGQIKLASAVGNLTRARSPESSATAATHEIVVDEAGHRRLVRRRYSAI